MKNTPETHQGMAFEIEEGHFAIVAIFRHNEKVDSAYLVGRLDEVDRGYVHQAAFSLVDSMRTQAIRVGAIPPQPVN